MKRKKEKEKKKREREKEKKGVFMPFKFHRPEHCQERLVSAVFAAHAVVAARVVKRTTVVRRTGYLPRVFPVAVSACPVWC